MFDDPDGPIEHFSWATFIVCGGEHSKTERGKQGKGKDIRLIGTKVSKWKDREGHQLTPSMVTGVFDQDVEILVIGTGVYGTIQCSEKVLKNIRNKGIDKIVLAPTAEACQTYNQLYHQGKRVALLAHGTC